MNTISKVALAAALFFGCLFFFASGASAQTCEAGSGHSCYYISTSGSGSTCSFVSPCGTWSAAQSLATAGDYIYYRGGSYTSANQFIAYDKVLNGAAGERITIKAYPGEAVTFNNQGGKGGLAAINGSGAILQGFNFTNANCISSTANGLMGTWTAGVQINGTFHTLRNSHFYNVIGEGNGNCGTLRVQGASDITIHNNHFEKLYYGAGNRTNIQHIIMFDGGNKTIYNNYFEQDQAYGQGCIYNKHGNTSGQILIYNNFFKDCAGFAFGNDGQDTNFHHNIVRSENGASRGIEFTPGGQGAHNNFTIEYNTFYSSSQTVINGSYGIPSNSVFRRNIVYQMVNSINDNMTMRLAHYGPDSDYTTETFDLDNNCYKNTVGNVRFSWFGATSGSGAGPLGAIYSSFTAWKNSGEGKDQNSIEADPQFVNVAANDFTLKSGSACAAMGVYATSNPGNPPLTAAAALGGTSKPPLPAGATGVSVR